MERKDIKKMIEGFGCFAIAYVLARHRRAKPVKPNKNPGTKRTWA